MTTTNPTGYIPPEQRTTDQTVMGADMDAMAGTFADRAEVWLAELPAQVVLAELELKANNGKLTARSHQLSGSCVGAAAAHSYVQAACGDIVHRGDVEGVKNNFMMGAYGHGRYLAGMRKKGSGSFGAAQAKACSPTEFGILPYDDKRVPQPKFSQDGKGCPWIAWTEREEIDWSLSSQWPAPYETLRDDSHEYGFDTIARIRTIDETKQALAQGYGVTMAGMFGTSPMKIRPTNGLLIAPYNGQWAHQQSIVGYTNEEGGLIAVQNQWKDCHGYDRIMHGDFGMTGCYWITESVYQRLLSARDTEIFAHSATGGFPTQQFDWGDHGWTYT